MNLRKKKILAAKTLNVGKSRIKFNERGLDEIKEAITKEDIRMLHSQGFIMIKPVRGRRKIEKRKTRRGAGKIKMKIKKRKKEYVIITRKLRKYLKQLRNEGKINREQYYNLRKKIKMKAFKNKVQFKEYIENSERDKEKTEEKKTKRSKTKLKNKKTEKIRRKNTK